MKQTVFALLILLLGTVSAESAEIQSLDLFAGFLTLAAFLQEFAGSLMTIGAADPNVTDEEGFTSLQRAAKNFDVEKVRDLLQTPGICISSRNCLNAFLIYNLHYNFLYNFQNSPADTFNLHFLFWYFLKLTLSDLRVENNSVSQYPESWNTWGSKKLRYFLFSDI